MTPRSLLKLLCVALALQVAQIAAAGAQDAPRRSIVQVAGELYRFQNNAHYSVFLVTDEGVIVADPINADTAAWLEKEIAYRFGQPVRYVIYSHDHADHISGGGVFADTATFVSQAGAKPKIAAGGHGPVPTITFDDFLEIELGGKHVELYFPGPSHSDNLIVMRFVEARALFVVDVASVRRLPYRTLPDYHFPGTIEALKRIEALDFDIFVGGHGPLGVKQDVIDHRGYMEALHGAVAKARADGLSLDEAKATIKLEDYRDWARYEAWLPENIEGLWRLVN